MDGPSKKIGLTHVLDEYILSERNLYVLEF